MHGGASSQQARCACAVTYWQDLRARACINTTTATDTVLLLLLLLPLLRVIHPCRCCYAAATVPAPTATAATAARLLLPAHLIGQLLKPQGLLQALLW
jgi:ABC-type methionine transport system permease subunit